MQTKLLGMLVALQCAGIAFLVYRALGDVPAAAVLAPASAAQSAAPAAAADEARLRQIIREELSAQLAATPAAGAARVALAPGAPRDAQKDRLQRERVEQQIERYRSAGAITDAQMTALQDDIAQLDPDSRREMLSKLSRAMNAQEIQGRM